MKVAILLMANLFSIFLFLKSPKSKIYHEVRRIEFSAFRLSILSVLFLLPLAIFVGGSIQGYSLLEVAIFSEQYRQGVYSGSGIYTAWSTQVLPLIIFVILITNGPSKSLAIPIFVVILSCMILGLRIHLWGLFIGFFLMLVKDLTIRKIFIGICFALLFFSYKYLLYPQDEIMVYDLIIQQLTRPDLHAIVKFEPFSDSIIDMFEYFPFVRHFLGHDLSAFKEFYVPTIPNVSVLMPFVSLYSGVALPGHVMLYNSLFVLTIIPSFFILLTTYNLIILTRKAKIIFLKFFFAYLFIVISLMFLEDVNLLYKLEEEMIFVFLSYIGYVLISRRNFQNESSLKC